MRGGRGHQSAATVTTTLAPNFKNAVSRGTRLHGLQALHVALVVNQVLLRGNEFGTCVPPLSHKQITHLSRIAFMGICVHVRAARVVTRSLGPHATGFQRSQEVGLVRGFFAGSFLVGGQRRGRPLRRP
jgi:hypothetical protein